MIFFFLLSQKGMGAHQYILNNIIHREFRGILLFFLLSMMRILFNICVVYIHKSQQERQWRALRFDNPSNFACGKGLL